MSSWRKFIRKSGLGLAGLAITPWNEINTGITQDESGNSLESKGSDLTALTNASLLAEWGFLNVLSFGADPTGTIDSTAAIQSAIEAGYNQEMGVLFPLGKYIISDTLYLEKYWPNTAFPRKCHILVGHESNGQRPLIKLAASAPLFDNASSPRAMLVWVNCILENKLEA